MANERVQNFSQVATSIVTLYPLLTSLESFELEHSKNNSSKLKVHSIVQTPRLLSRDLEVEG